MSTNCSSCTGRKLHDIKNKERALKKNNISISKEKIADFCKRHHIKKLAFFGSFLRDDFNPASDIDVLLEFELGHTPGLDFFSMEIELSELLGHKVDLNTPGFISPYFRDEVIAESEVYYAEK